MFFSKKFILFYIFIVNFFNMIQCYNMNNFPIIKKLFDRRNQKKYSKKSYIHYNLNNYALNKIILDDIADKIVGPKRNNTGFSNK